MPNGPDLAAAPVHDLVDLLVQMIRLLESLLAGPGLPL